MRASGWHNGGSAANPGGYGIKFTQPDCDRYFRQDWAEVVLELADAATVNVNLTPSFWTSCSELRSAAIGRWLLQTGAAPWARGQPPGIVIRPIENNRFAVHILKQHELQ